MDAAIAAVAAQGVVAPETCGVGGDLFALVHEPGWDRPMVLNASGRSGSNARPGALRAAGATEVPTDDRLTVTIPGCVDGLCALSDTLGTLPMSTVLAPAIELANGGFDVSPEQARAFGLMAGAIAGQDAVSEFYPEGSPVSTGEHICRPRLGKTLSAVAAGGRDAFYQGQAGEDISNAVDGLITLDDLANSHVDWVQPIGVQTAGLTAWTVPPNSQGYLGPATLALFEMLDPPEDPDDPLSWHLLIESYRALAWERNDIVSDPEHAPLPNSMLMANDRLSRIAETISADTAGVWPDRIGELSDTAYMCAVDSAGMAVSIIQSNYRGIGSPFGASRSGFMLHDRGGGFGLTPGHPNELGPNKRPLHTLAPTLWTEGVDPKWVLGTRGGAVQPQLIAQMAQRVMLRSIDPETAQTASRWTISNFGPHSSPQLQVEPGVPPTVLSDLRSRGHVIEELSGSQAGWGPVSMIGLTDDGRVAAADPRVATATASVF